jgi:hypothetical protein
MWMAGSRAQKNQTRLCEIPIIFIVGADDFALTTVISTALG